MVSCGPPPPGTGVLVSEKPANEPTLGTLAFTVYVPSMPLAVKVFEVAMPEELVCAVLEGEKLPLGPLGDGAEKVTTAPFTGLLPESATLTTNGAPKAVLIVALCGD